MPAARRAARSSPPAAPREEPHRLPRRPGSPCLPHAARRGRCPRCRPPLYGRRCPAAAAARWRAYQHPTARHHAWPGTHPAAVRTARLRPRPARAGRRRPHHAL